MLTLNQLVGFAAVEEVGGGTAPIVADQAVNFGALTLASNGGFAPLNTGDAITSASIDSGDASGHFQISSTGVITPTAAGDTADLSGGTYALVCTFTNATGSDGATITATAVADDYSTLADDTEIGSALTDIGTASSGARSVTIRPGTFSPVDATYTGRAFVNTVTLGGQVETTYTDIEVIADDMFNISNTDNLKLQYVQVYRQGVVNTEACVYIRNGSDGVTITRCWLHGDSRDTNADYSSGNYENVGNGIGNDGTASPLNVTVTENVIEDVGQGVAFGGGVGGTVDVHGNIIRRFYYDGIQIKPDTAGTLLTGATRISRNSISQFIGDPADTGNPHPDAIQLSSDNRDWAGVDIWANHIWIGDARGASIQGITEFSGTTDTHWLQEPRIVGNVVLVDSAHGITIERCQNPLVVGNTVCDPNEGTSFTVSINLGISTGGGTDGQVTLYSNIAEGYDVNNGATTDDQWNVTLGNGGVTNTYASVFDGPTFDPQTNAEMRTKFNMKSSGPADQDASGGPTLRDSGALGTGYATLGTEGEMAGWSLDTAYEYIQNFVYTNGTAYHTMPALGANPSKMTLSMWLNLQRVNGDYQNLLHMGGSHQIRTFSRLTILLRDSAGTIVYNSITTGNELSLNTTHHVEIAVDLSVPSLRFKIDGVAPAMTDTVSLIAGTGLLRFDSTAYLLSDTAQVDLVDGQVADYFLDTTQVIDDGVLYNGGNPPNMRTIGSPSVLLGARMKSSERYGNAAEGWNDSFNLGSETLTTSSPSYTDEPQSLILSGVRRRDKIAHQEWQRHRVYRSSRK